MKKRGNDNPKMGFVLRLYPNESQRKLIERSFGICRFAYNHFAAECFQALDSGTLIPGEFELNRELTGLKAENPWMAECDSTALTSVSTNVSYAFSNYFKKLAKRPRFRSKKCRFASYTSKCVNSNISIIDDRHIRLPKLGTMYIRSGRSLLSLSGEKGFVIKSATIRRNAAGQYYVSLLAERENQALPKTGKAVGMDVGLDSLAVLSDGTKYGKGDFCSDLFAEKHEWEKKRARRLLLAKAEIKKDKKAGVTPARTLLDFSNYQKACQMVAKIDKRIADRRKDRLEKISTEIVRNYDVIVAEDIKSLRMLKNHKLAKAIENASWNAFLTMISQKCAMYGKAFIQVGPRLTSQICYDCGASNERLGLSPYEWLKVREWDCPNCGAHHDRDVNAAKNILRLSGIDCPELRDGTQALGGGTANSDPSKASPLPTEQIGSDSPNSGGSDADGGQAIGVTRSLGIHS